MVLYDDLLYSVFVCPSVHRYSSCLHSKCSEVCRIDFKLGTQLTGISHIMKNSVFFFKQNLCLESWVNFFSLTPSAKLKYGFLLSLLPY